MTARIYMPPVRDRAVIGHHPDWALTSDYRRGALLVKCDD